MKAVKGNILHLCAYVHLRLPVSLPIYPLVLCVCGQVSASESDDLSCPDLFLRDGIQGDSEGQAGQQCGGSDSGGGPSFFFL